MMHNGKNLSHLRILEAEILSMEEELKQLYSRLEIKGLDTIEITRLKAQYEDITIALDVLLSEWEQGVRFLRDKKEPANNN